LQERSENRRVAREILAIAEEYFADHEDRRAFGDLADDGDQGGELRFAAAV
jgi:hypothetical protein